MSASITFQYLQELHDRYEESKARFEAAMTSYQEFSQLLLTSIPNLKDEFAMTQNPPVEISEVSKEYYTDGIDPPQQVETSKWYLHEQECFLEQAEYEAEEMERLTEEIECAEQMGKMDYDCLPSDGECEVECMENELEDETF